ncbi:MAG TPA: ABC transporter substrate-binding protein [Solirubrobacteraceae bacterium]|nr:ABC transporter substrate-binding protein [Solirubrobacteraceae bacterium]
MSRAPARILSRKAGRIVQSLAAAGLCVLWIAACGSSGGAHGPAHLVYYAPIDPNGTNVNAAATCSKHSGGAYTISITPEANSSDASRSLIVQRLAAHDGDYSLLNMDTIWTAEFAAAGWLQKITGANRQEALQGVLPIAAQSAEYKGGLYAVPLNTNAQLLWYRKDLLAKIHQPVPTTWAQIISDAQKLPASEGLIEEQGQQYEGYTVWFNSVLASAGGEVVNQQDQPVLGQKAVLAAQVIKDVATSGRADPSLSTDQEDQGRLAFEAGKAAFLLNWPYVYAAGRTDAKTDPVTKHVFENMGWAPYPGVYPGVPGKSSVGGANIGVSAYTKYPKQALAAALCMTRYRWENQEAINEGLPPVTIASYSNPAVVKQYPFAAILLKQLQNATNRPETPFYSDVTLAIQQSLHPPASIKPTQDINSLRSCVKTLLKGGLC